MIRPTSYAPRSASLILLTLILLALIPLSQLEANPQISNLQFSHPGGYYPDTLFLELSGDGTIWFTLDGRIPTPATATRYTTPIPLLAAEPQVVIVRARLQTAANHFSPTISHSYFLNIPAQLPLLSLIVDPDDFWGAERGIITHYEEHGRDWERPIDLTYVDTDRQSSFHIPAGVRVHGRGSRPLEKKSLRLYFRAEYGQSRLHYPLFSDSSLNTDYRLLSTASFKRLVLHNGGQDATIPGTNWTLLRNQIAATLAQSIGSNATRSQPALLFVNGEFWGIYQIRERIDDHFLADHFGIETADMLDTPEELIRTDHIVLGDRAHWDAMLDFVVNNDLTDPVNYAYLGTQMDIANYIDYNLLQIFIANDDWPHHNMRVFRPHEAGGRWQWMFWDTDRSFAYRIASPVEKNMLIHAQTNVETASGRQVILLQKLLANREFRNAFLVRCALLLHDEFSTAAVLNHIETLAGELASDIDLEAGRWPTDGDAWAAHIEQLRDFARRRPDILRQHIVSEFQLPGLVNLQLNPSDNGLVLLENRVVEAEWQGSFFSGSIVRLTAVPRSGYQFTGWQELDGPASLDLALVTEQTLTPLFAPLPDGAPRVGDVVITAVTPTTIHLQTTRTTDLRGWRITDNDSPSATDEGSLIFSDDLALAQVAAGTTLVIDLIDLEIANGRLDTHTDPGFYIGQRDAIILLAPGQTADFADDLPIAAYTTTANLRLTIGHNFRISPAAVTGYE